MASIHREFTVEADPNIVWSAIQDVWSLFTNGWQRGLLSIRNSKRRSNRNISEMVLWSESAFLGVDSHTADAYTILSDKIGTSQRRIQVFAKQTGGHELSGLLIYYRMKWEKYPIRNDRSGNRSYERVPWKGDFPRASCQEYR